MQHRATDFNIQECQGPVLPMPNPKPESRKAMADKKSFVLRIDEDTYKALEKWAADEFRSVNGQIEWIIDRALKESGRKKHSEKASKGSEKK